MSIRKNNKIIAGSINVVTTDFNELIQKYVKDEFVNNEDTLTSSINQQVTDRVKTEISDNLDSITSSVTNNINEEIKEEINTSVTNATADLDTKINTAVNTEVKNSVDTATSELNNKLSTDITTKINNLINKINSEMVGMQKTWTGPKPPSNYIFMQGQEVLRADYPLLYQYAIDNGLIVEDIIWQDYKRFGLYSYGDGETTFRIPNMVGYYLVGYDKEYHTDLATEQIDTLPNITGSLDLQGTNGSTLSSTSNADGVFEITTKETEGYPVTGSTTLSSNLIDTITFDLSNEYTTGDRVQPRSIPVNYIVCYKGTL
jgi:hypothetical protein